MINVTAHVGDPCIFCGVAHDDIVVGPCNGRQSEAMYEDAIKSLERCARGDGFELMRLEAQAILDELQARLHVMYNRKRIGEGD